MPKLNIQNAEFYYEIHGSGYPMILISGYTRDHLGWLPILDSLAKHFQIILFDNRAVGQTKDNGKPFTAEIMAKDVMALADALNLDKPHIIGHSMGGTIAQAVATQFPKKIGKIGILSSVAKWRTAMLKGLKSTLNMRIQNLSFDLIFDAQFPWVYGEPFINSDADIAKVKKAILENPYPQSIEDQARQYQVLQQFDGRSQVKNIEAETLIVYGSQDILALPYESLWLAQHIPNAKSVELDAGHALTLETPKELVNTLKEFFK